MKPDPRILIVDNADGRLQSLAMELLGRDFEVHYASDPDEAQLLAGDTDGQISAVIFVASGEIERIPTLAARYRVSPAALIPFGERPAKRVVAALAHHGVRWHLWDDPTDQSVRFVISGVLHEHDPFELRYHLRVPTNISAEYVSADRKSDTRIQDLGRGGACLVGGNFGETGELGTLSFCFDERSVEIPTRIAWAVPDENPALAIVGVSFQEVDPESGQVVDDVLTSIIARHRIEKPA